MSARSAETALLNISSRVSAIGLNNSWRIHTAMPQTDIGSIIVSFNERIGLTVVVRTVNSRMSTMEKNVVINFVICLMLFHES